MDSRSTNEPEHEAVIIPMHGPIECFGCGLLYQRYPRVDGVIRCQLCGSYEVRLSVAHENWKPKH